MAVNRKAFGGQFTKFTTLNVKCWSCKSLLRPIENTIFSKETSASCKNHSHPNWDPEDTRSTFSGLAACTNSMCDEPYSIIGTSTLNTDFSNSEIDFIEYFQIKYICPSPHVIDLPEGCSKTITSSVYNIGSVMFEQFGMVGNRIRTCVEQVLAEVDPSLTGKLHHKIQKFTKNNEDVGNYLMAIKWLGNTSSHDDSITKDDVCDALDILENVLHKLYDLEDDRISKIVNRINMASKK